MARAALKGIKCYYTEILCKKFVGRLFKRNKISNEDILRLQSPQRELSDVLHWHVCSLSYYHSKFLSLMNDFDAYPFSLPQNGGK